MYYAPSRPKEIEKFPIGYIKPIAENLEFLQRPPVDNRRIQDYYGKAQDQPTQQMRTQNKEKLLYQGGFYQPQQFTQEKQWDNIQKENQNQQVGSNINPQRITSQETFQSAPFQTIYTNENIYELVGAPQNFPLSEVQPLESRISPSNLRGPNRGYEQGQREYSQDFQQPSFGFFPQDSRDFPSEQIGMPLQGYRRMAPPGIQSDYRRGIPEPVLSLRNHGRELRRDFQNRVIPITDYRQGHPVNFQEPPQILNERNGLPLDYRGYPYQDYDRQRFEPPFEYRTYRDPRDLPAPDYYVSEYQRFSPIRMQRDFNERIPFTQGLPYQDEVYPPLYGRMDQQIFREGRQDYDSGRFYPPYEERGNYFNQRIKQV
ncbi:unnamed protein product [Paramecium primaurelia]|uniref:Uncharacterized protein n=1 Tax=Paramecium primaurelia TaxID=5886 RepID=A0A8S1LAF1_PARPR|nr:unnamed protein product [Paramecium primaurelia]